MGLQDHRYWRSEPRRSWCCRHSAGCFFPGQGKSPVLPRSGSSLRPPPAQADGFRCPHACPGLFVPGSLQHRSSVVANFGRKDCVRHRWMPRPDSRDGPTGWGLRKGFHHSQEIAFIVTRWLGSGPYPHGGLLRLVPCRLALRCGFADRLCTLGAWA